MLKKHLYINAVCINIKNYYSFKSTAFIRFVSKRVCGEKGCSENVCIKMSCFRSIINQGLMFGPPSSAWNISRLGLNQH